MATGIRVVQSVRVLGALGGSKNGQVRTEALRINGVLSGSEDVKVHMAAQLPVSVSWASCSGPCRVCTCSAQPGSAPAVCSLSLSALISLECVLCLLLQTDWA